MKKRALVSVSDKTGVVEFCKNLTELGYEIISTGGTAKELEANNIPTINVSEITKYPECLDGRVKTLHPALHAGILAMRSNKEHIEQLEKLNINTIDIVAVNLYPFKKTILKDKVTRQEAIENIDIGGPSMIRAAAKNYQDVVVVCDPTDYNEVIARLKAGTVDIDYKLRLMYKVFQQTAVYDTLIANYLGDLLGEKPGAEIALAFEKAQDLRYGENPHQQAAFYKEVIPPSNSIARAVQLHGKELSFNNINDTNSAIEIVTEFSEPAIVALKHTIPCGVATAKTISEAYAKAYNADPTSIFGGIIAANREVDEPTAEQISKIFIEVVVAPSFTAGAIAILTKKANIRLLKLESINEKPAKRTFDFKRVNGGLLVQESDDSLFNESELKVVTKTKPSKIQLEQLKFGYKIVKHCKSNAIVISKDFVTTGVGAGQTNRIWATEEAVARSGKHADGAVLASDAFFPFPDCVEAAAKAGVKAIIQPGGSNNDQMSIDACDKYGIAMVFCGQRHFKH